jgi:hypothetical protein
MSCGFVAPELAPLSLCPFGQEPAVLPPPRIGRTTVIAIEEYNDHVYVQLNALYMQARQLLSDSEQHVYFDTVWSLSHAFQATASFQRGNTIGNSSGV